VTRETVLREALKLPRRERADVAAELLASLDDELNDNPQEIETAWTAEIAESLHRGPAVAGGRYRLRPIPSPAEQTVLEQVGDEVDEGLDQDEADGEGGGQPEGVEGEGDCEGGGDGAEEAEDA